jgi:hypothetical protein
MKKSTIIALSVLAGILVTVITCLAFCSIWKGGSGDYILDEAVTFKPTDEIRSLDIELAAADFKIVVGEELKVETNLKYFSISCDGDVWVMRDKTKGSFRRDDAMNAMFTLYVPEGTVFDRVNMKTGAAKMTVETLSANAVNIELGAGDAHFEQLNASSKIEINGGAGEFTVSDGTLNNLTVDFGTGRLDLTAALRGENELSFGLGEANITLIGGMDDYTVDIEKDIGSITVDGNPVNDFGCSGGENRVEINGGVGAISLNFKDTATK